MITNKIYTARAQEPMNLFSGKLLQMPEYRPPRTFRGGIWRRDDATYMLLQPTRVLILGTPDVEKFTGETGIALQNLTFKRSHYEADAVSKMDLFSKVLLKSPHYTRPSNFTGGILKLPGGTYLLFESGKVVINGVKTLPDLPEFSLMTDILLTDLQLSHCSGSLNVGPQDLEELSHRIEHSTYEPELYPGLTFKIDNVSVIVQRKGTVMFCGCRNEDDAKRIGTEIMKLINT